MTTAVHLSVELHRALMGMTTGEVSFNVVRCTPSLADSFVHALICIENGVDVPAAVANLRLPNGMAHSLPPAQPDFRVQQAAYLTFESCLGRFGHRVLQRRLQDAHNHLKALSKGACKAGKPQSQGRDPWCNAVEPEAPFMTLGVINRSRATMTEDERRDISDRLRDRKKFNRILAHLHEHGCSSGDICSFAALLIAILLPVTPGDEFKRLQAGYFSLPEWAGGLYAPLTRDELAVYGRIGDIIRSEPDWRTQVKQEAAIKQWKQRSVDTHGFTSSMAIYLVDKLSWMATLPFGASVEFTQAPGVFVCNDLLDDTAFAAMSQAVDLYADCDGEAPEDCKDCCSASCSQRTHLVDPSLYGLTDRTHITSKQTIVRSSLVARAREYLQDLRLGTTSESRAELVKRDMKPPYPRSSDAAKPLRSRIDCTPYTYMWIPAEVRTSSRGTEAAFASYVNGLSPFTETSRRLYDPIAKAFAAMLPLFEASLAFSPLRGDPAFLQAFRKGSRRKGHNLVRNQLGRPSSSRMAAPSPASTGSSRWRPTVGSFVPPPLRTVKLCGKTLQVVVRLTKADVAPKAPAKHSHKWHLQGLPDESICASGIHYLACSNVHPPRSLFRVAVDGECWDAAQYQHLQDHQKKDLFGFSSEDLHAGFAQDIGSVEPQPGGCFVYPGFMARKESPLKLIDPTKPGHLVTLEIYLVDPERPTLSSTRTVPQRVDWLRDATLEGTSEDPRCRLNRLPNEILHRIFAALEDDVGQGELRSTARSARPATFLASRAFALQRRSADIARRASEDCEIMAAFDEEYGRGYADEAYRDSQERLERRFAGLGVRLPPGGFTHANRSGNRARSRF